MRLNHVKLSSAHIDQLKYFYAEKFQFPVVKEEKSEITFELGRSRLTFTENRLQNAYYHFAFNIPHQQLEEALKWAKSRVDILTYDKKEIQDFPAWKARSFYFLDPAGNIVEFIARERIEEPARDKFGVKSILNVSEVGIPVFQVSSAFKALNDKTGIEKFDYNDNTFCACGNDEGLFIIVDKAEKRWFPTEETARSFPLSVDFEENNHAYTLNLQPGDSFQVIDRTRKQN
ncbi:MAG: VOC family protein [Owenweeksia sp.]